MHLYLQEGDKWHHLTQDDLTWKYPELFSLNPGDYVTTYVANDCCGRGLGWFWEVSINNHMILSYENTYKSLSMQGKNTEILAQYFIYIGILLTVFGVGFRYIYGKWSS